MQALTVLVALVASAATCLASEFAETFVDGQAEVLDALPDFMAGMACSRVDQRSALSKCMSKNFQALIPAIKNGGRLGLPSLEPYFVPEVNVDFSSQAVDFHATMSKMNVTSMSGALVLDVRPNLRRDSMDMEVDILFPVMTFRGLFEFTNGLFAQWSFQGRGPFEFTFRMIRATWKFQGQKHRNARYMTISSAEPVYAIGGMKFWAKDLVEGYPALDDVIVSMGNRLWKEVVEAGRPVVQKALADHIRLLADSVFQSVPYDVLFPAV